MMVFLISKAKKIKDKELFLEALEYGNKGIDSVDSDKRKYFSKGSMHFEIGRWLAGLNNEFSELRVKHYEEAINEGGFNKTTLAYSWYNMSGELLRLDRCKESKIAAETALSIKDFRYARTNLAKAKRCIARDNIIYRCWLYIETWFKKLLGIHAECPDYKC